MTSPIVTVLMPVYNAGAFLRPTLETILGQTYREFEFLIINDCSTDDSLETIRSFGDPRIRVHTNPVNMGQTKSLNVGLRLARGKYIVVNDADDYSLPKRIETQLDFIMKNPEYPVVGTSCYIMDREGKILRTFLRPTDPREIQLQFLSDTPMTHGSVIMQKDAILAMGGYNEDFRIIQDYELWSTLMRKGTRVMNIPDILVVIRTFADSISFKERDAQTHRERENHPGERGGHDGTDDLPGRGGPAETLFRGTRSLDRMMSSTGPSSYSSGNTRTSFPHGTPGEIYLPEDLR